VFPMSNATDPQEIRPGLPPWRLVGIYGDGKIVNLSDFRGRTVVLYFYPKDDTRE